MKKLVDKIVALLSKIVNYKYTFLILCFLNLVITFLSILKPTIIVGLIFIFLNTIFVLVSTNNKGMQNVIFLYPLSRVLKIPGISTSLFTIILLIFIVSLLIKLIINRFKNISTNKIIFLFLFVFYVLYTFVVSLINYGSFSFNRLFSYYLYLSFPIVCVFALTSDDQIDGVNNILLFSISYLVGMLYTIGFHYLIPNGDDLLANAGVNIFDMKTYGIRFSPLSDDPNYGTCVILLLSSLFLAAIKTKKQIMIGVPVILLNFILSAFSLSKMFYLCLIIIFGFYALKIIFNLKSVILAGTITMFSIVFLFVFLGTSFGQTLLIRIIGTTDGISLNRITSGRTVLFGEYSSYIMSNPFVLLFGKGPIYSDFSLFSNGEHNTFTANILGNGLIGVGIMLLVLFLMAKERFDKLNHLPKNFNFYGFLVCLLICCMSLSIAPSTVFPILVVSAQFVKIEDDIKCNSSNNKKDKSLSHEEIMEIKI